MFAYRQKGTKENWCRYLSLGFFVLDDCFECDKIWAAMDMDPLQVHRSIWYNFRYYVDQEMDIPPQLNAWAMNISREYLSHFDPTTLHGTDTLVYSWKSMPFMTTTMDIDDQPTWIPVTGRRRSKSPPTNSIAHAPPAAGRDVGILCARNPSPNGLSKLPTKPSLKDVTKQQPTNQHSQHISWSQRLTPVITVTEDEDKEDHDEVQGNVVKDYPASTFNSSLKAPSKLPPHPNISTNDGTYRVNVRWTPPESTYSYEKDKKKLNDAIHEIAKAMVPPEVGTLYRWESEDLILSKSAHNMTASEMREFITPAITIAHSKHQIVFGLRVGFTIVPNQWMRSAVTKTLCKSQKLEVSVSNSTSTSGKMVTAGYVLLKAPNTTQLHRYTQFLRSLLPENTPYFDVVRYKKTPMDQLIPHLRIQCGEKHVTPLCQVLLPVLTGRGRALFIPRYALGSMPDEKIRSHFQFHERWAQSLKAIPMSPQINHLDQARIEYFEDGTIIERSTREWASTILAPDNSSPALCDVVNGPPDHKAYLLVPRHYFQKVQQEWQQYKSRLYPPNHREARYRDNLPGLPDIIHIQAEIAANVSFLEHLSAASEWQQAPAFIPITPPVDNQGDALAPGRTRPRSTATSPAWPSLAAASISSRRHQSAWSVQNSKIEEELNSAGGNTSLGTEEDRSTVSTRSLTYVSRLSSDTRYHDLERSVKKKLQALDTSGQKSSERLKVIEHQLSRIDDLDQKLAAVTKQLDVATTQLANSGITQKQISNDMEAMKALSEQQFQTMNQRLLVNMENQHKMSTTMLDLHNHFEKMSAFMEGLATKMEFDRTQGPITLLAKTPSVTHQIANASADSRSIGTSVSSASSSSQSTFSMKSAASSTVYCSPEKKKQRSHRKVVRETTNTMDIPSQHSFGETSEGERAEYTDVCANLEDTFRSQEPSQRAFEHESPTVLAPIVNPVAPHHNLYQSAPLDPNNTNVMDLDGVGTQ